jgi:hypothetical protein
MSFFRKKPVVVEAVQWNGTSDDIMAIKKAFPKLITHSIMIDSITKEIDWSIQTKEGHHKVSQWDWIVKGVKGEFYPCKPDVFQMTYEEVHNATD